MKLRTIPCIALLTLPMAAHADGWTGDFAAGLLLTTGNTESQSINGSAALGYLNGPWKNAFKATGINTADGDETTAELYTIGDKVDYTFSDRHYAFGALEWQKDLYGGIRESMSETVGYGYHVLTGPAHMLDLEIGGGARQTEQQDTGDKEKEAIGRAGALYSWKISDTSSFSQSLRVESGKSDTFTESISELKLSLVGPIFVGLSYTVRNHSDVPADTKKTDTFAAVSLSYSFGKEEG